MALLWLCLEYSWKKSGPNLAENWAGYCEMGGREGYRDAMGSLPRKYMETAQSKRTRAGDVAQSPEFNSPALWKN